VGGGVVGVLKKLNGGWVVGVELMMPVPCGGKRVTGVVGGGVR
jgi:hypothetical protein